MAIRATKVTRKGQITIPIDFREKYHIKEGDTVLVEDRDGHLTIQQRDQSVDRTAGALAHYAKGIQLTPAEMREAAEQAIADQVWEEMQEIERCRKT
jgi:AbrB family looped-hinge helix DNA binding protein